MISLLTFNNVHPVAISAANRVALLVLGKRDPEGHVPESRSQHEIAGVGVLYRLAAFAVCVNDGYDVGFNIMRSSIILSAASSNSSL